MDSLTDNWTLSDVAHLLTGNSDCMDVGHWVETTHSEYIIHETVVAATQVHSLATLLEQIVLCEKIYTLSGWIGTWEGMNQDLDDLFNEGAIRILGQEWPSTDSLEKFYLETLEASPTARIKLVEVIGDAEFQPRNFSRQLIEGSAKYLAASDHSDIAYSPHPIRARFIDDCLWYPKWPTLPVSRFDNLINQSRVKLSRRVGETTSTIRLTCALPSIAFLCLAESRNSSPLSVARELREHDEVKEFRSSLSQLSDALDEDRVNDFLHLISKLHDALIEVERCLGLRHKSQSDVPTVVNIFGLPLKVPEAFRIPFVSPKHTGIMFRLASTGVYDLEEVMSSSLGIRSEWH